MQAFVEQFMTQMRFGLMGKKKKLGMDSDVSEICDWNNCHLAGLRVAARPHCGCTTNYWQIGANPGLFLCT